MNLVIKGGKIHFTLCDFTSQELSEAAEIIPAYGNSGVGGAKVFVALVYALGKARQQAINLIHEQTGESIQALNLLSAVESSRHVVEQSGWLALPKYKGPMSLDEVVKN